MTGSSTTLKEIGFVDFLSSGKHSWNNLKEKIVSEKDPKKQAELRKKSITSEYFLGSVHAVTQLGEVVVASATGSQLSSYVYRFLCRYMSGMSTDTVGLYILCLAGLSTVPFA